MGECVSWAAYFVGLSITIIVEFVPAYFDSWPGCTLTGTPFAVGTSLGPCAALAVAFVGAVRLFGAANDLIVAGSLALVDT
jgi:hypothetical protein